jgi:ferredoxin
MSDGAKRDMELRVDMIACDAYGYCAELLPELVELDEWGYPIVSDKVTPELLAHAQRAAAACPKLALRLAEGKSAPPMRPLRLVERGMR